MEQNCYLCIVVNNKSSLIYEVFRIRGRIKDRRMLGNSERGESFDMVFTHNR